MPKWDRPAYSLTIAFQNNAATSASLSADRDVNPSIHENDGTSFLRRLSVGLGFEDEKFGRETIAGLSDGVERQKGGR